MATCGRKNVPTEPARDEFDETFPFSGKTRDDTHSKFSRSRGFHDNFFLLGHLPGRGSAVATALSSAAKENPRENWPLRCRRCCCRHNNGGKYRSNFFTAPCCFPPPAPFPSRSRSRGETPFHSPEFPEKHAHTHTKHATQIHRIHFLRVANQHFLHSIGHERGQQRRKTPFRGTVPLFFRGHCSE